MEFFKSFYKNDAIKKYFSDKVIRSSGADPGHAYIIEGPVGSGKLTFVRMLSAMLECEAERSSLQRLPCEECRNCRNIIAGNSSDFIVVDRGDDQTIKIDAVRKIKSDIYLSSNEYKYKIYVIREAERLTDEAQNALLIFLEEPPPNVIIFLLCSSSSSLLETVRSRSVTLRMQIFSKKEIIDYLNVSCGSVGRLSKEELNAVAVAGAGSIGRTLSLLDPKTAKMLNEEHDRVCRDINALSSRSRFSDIYDVFAGMSQKRDELSQRLSSMCLAVSDLISVKRTDQDPKYYYSREDAVEAAVPFTLARLVSLYDLFADALRDVSESNANIRSVLALLPYKIKTI